MTALDKLKLEAGKFYRTRDGRKVGPLERRGAGWAEIGSGSGQTNWRDDGVMDVTHAEYEGYDIIDEWADGTALDATENKEALCPACLAPINEDGEATHPACYYCPEDGTCTVCGAGQCDQSC